jgi:hypothetical protein
MAGKLDDLRQGKLEATAYYSEVDLPFYKRELSAFLPDSIIDAFVLAIEPAMLRNRPQDSFGFRICPQGMTCENVLAMYELLFPGKRVQVLFSGYPALYADTSGQNSYLGQKARELGQWGLGLCNPGWSASQLEDEILSNDLLGFKQAWLMIGAQDSEDISIFEFLPHHHLDVANKHSWIVILQLMRKGIADVKNIKEIRDICQAYPNLNLVLAHMGRARCRRAIQEGLSMLSEVAHFPNLYVDISATANQAGFELLSDVLTPQRILFGTDAPFTAIRAKMACDEDDNYYFYIRGADWEDDRTRRRPEEEDTYTFFIYENILAFREASERCNLGRRDIKDVFYNNAARLITKARNENP